MQTALLLFACGFGYKIFAEASRKTDKLVKQLGKLIGAVIMIISLLGVVCTIWCATKCNSMGFLGGNCPTHGEFGKSMDKFSHGMSYDSKKPHCPIMGTEASDKDTEMDAKNKLVKLH